MPITLFEGDDEINGSFKADGVIFEDVSTPEEETDERIPYTNKKDLLFEKAKTEYVSSLEEMNEDLEESNGEPRIYQLRPGALLDELVGSSVRLQRGGVSFEIDDSDAEDVKIDVTTEENLTGKRNDYSTVTYTFHEGKRKGIEGSNNANKHKVENLALKLKRRIKMKHFSEANKSRKIHSIHVNKYGMIEIVVL